MGGWSYSHFIFWSRANVRLELRDLYVSPFFSCNSVRPRFLFFKSYLFLSTVCSMGALIRIGVWFRKKYRTQVKMTKSWLLGWKIATIFGLFLQTVRRAGPMPSVIKIVNILLIAYFGLCTIFFKNQTLVRIKVPIFAHF